MELPKNIIDRLSKYRILSVIGRHSSFALRGHHGEMREVKDKLTADYVLTGSIRKSGDRIRIAARLTDAKTEGAMWADHYDRPLQDRRMARTGTYSKVQRGSHTSIRNPGSA
jgi:adenylate cyclase